MPKRGDGNEQDLRVRPGGHQLTENPSNDPCGEPGEQIDLVVDTPSGTVTLAYNWADITGVCPKGFDIRQLDKLFIRVLKNHFSRSSNIIMDSLKQYTYSDNPADNKIRIALNTIWDAAQEGLRPAIIVKRGAQQSQRRVIGDLGERTDGQYGEVSFARFVTGNHQILAIGSTDGQTEDLAQELFQLFTCLSPVLRQQLPFHDFQCAGIGEIGIVEELGSTMAVPVSCAYTYEYGWTVDYVTPNLAHLHVQPTATL